MHRVMHRVTHRVTRVCCTEQDGVLKMLALETLVDITDSMVQWQRECAEGKLDKPEATVRPTPYFELGLLARPI